YRVFKIPHHHVTYCELALTGLLAILVFRAQSQDPDMKRCNIVRGDGKGRGVFNLLHYRDSQACTVQVNERLLLSAPLTLNSHCSERKLQYVGSFRQALVIYTNR
ncbi:hypothetical protein HHX47_DHR1001316, partial [Lentinula edodes]